MLFNLAELTTPNCVVVRIDRKKSLSAKMYSLYKELCINHNEKPVSKTTYKRIFCKEYNYSIFKPKKISMFFLHKV